MRQQTDHSGLGDLAFVAVIFALVVFFLWRLGMLG